MIHRRGRSAGARTLRAITLLEALIVLGVLGLVLGIVVWVLWFGTASSLRLAPQMALQQASRKAVVRFLRDLQQGMEVLLPLPGATLPYAVARDDVSAICFYHLVSRTDRPDGTMELWRYRMDPGQAPRGERELILSNVRRLSFTARSEGALQLNLLLAEGAEEYAIITTVRLRNIASAEEVWW